MPKMTDFSYSSPKIGLFNTELAIETPKILLYMNLRVPSIYLELQLSWKIS